MSETLRPARPVSPGQIIEHELEAREWTQRDLADIMSRPVQVINEIIRGTKQITPETALELAAAFGTTPELWVNLEANYRLHLTLRQQNTDSAAISLRSRLFSLLPISSMRKRGWIPETKQADELKQEVSAFLGGDPEVVVPSVNFRHTPSRSPEHGAMVAWVQRVYQLAKYQEVPPYDRHRLIQAIPDIRLLALEAEQVAQVPQMLQSLGIRFIIVPQLSKTYIDGAVCDAESAPIIALTLRYDRIDAFWFTLMHELAHLVLNHHDMHIDNLESEDLLRDDQEVAANQQARDWLVDQAALRTWAMSTKPYFSQAAICQFAATQRVHPGVVLGQLMRDGYVEYKHLRRLLERVQPYLAEWVDRPS